MVPYARLDAKCCGGDRHQEHPHSYFCNTQLHCSQHFRESDRHLLRWRAQELLTSILQMEKLTLRFNKVKAGSLPSLLIQCN